MFFAAAYFLVVRPAQESLARAEMGRAADKVESDISALVGQIERVVGAVRPAPQGVERDEIEAAVRELLGTRRDYLDESGTPRHTTGVMGALALSRPHSPNAAAAPTAAARHQTKPIRASRDDGVFDHVCSTVAKGGRPLSPVPSAG